MERRCLPLSEKLYITLPDSLLTQMIPPRREDMRVLVGSVIGPRTNCLVNASAHNHELWNVELAALAPQVRLSRWGAVGPSGSNGDHQTRTRQATILYGPPRSRASSIRKIEKSRRDFEGWRDALHSRS